MPEKLQRPVHIVKLILKSGRAVCIAVTNFTYKQKQQKNYESAEWQAVDEPTFKILKKLYPKLVGLTSVDCSDIAAVTKEETITQLPDKP